MNDKLKKIIFDKLYQDLKNVEIIPFNDSIWFIDREKKYWYLQYQMTGMLLWKYDFFNSFFQMFSLGKDEYEKFISDWVEEALNRKVVKTAPLETNRPMTVHDVLNVNE